MKKKSYKILGLINIIIIILLLINIIFIRSTSYLLLTFILSIGFITSYLLYSFEKCKISLFNNKTLIIITSSVLYILFTYFIGIFVGFNKNILYLNFDTLITSVIPYIILLIISELFRYQFIKKCEGSYINYSLVIILLTLVDGSLYLNNYDINTIEGIIYYICVIIFPSISKNTLLTYLVNRTGYIPNIIYRLLFDLKTILLPIFPNFGLYIDSVLGIIYPFIIGMVIHINDSSKRASKTIEKRSGHFSFGMFLVIFLVVLVSLTSCKFKYGMLSVGSESMEKTIYKGDAIIFSKKNIDDVNVGDIIVFRNSSKVIVHRVISIDSFGSNKYLYTKGDNNNVSDGYPINKNDLMGTVKFRIPYIGYPSVWLSELLN